MRNWTLWEFGSTYANENFSVGIFCQAGKKWHILHGAQNMKEIPQKLVAAFEGREFQGRNEYLLFSFGNAA